VQGICYHPSEWSQGLQPLSRCHGARSNVFSSKCNIQIPQLSITFQQDLLSLISCHRQLISSRLYSSVSGVWGKVPQRCGEACPAAEQRPPTVNCVIPLLIVLRCTTEEAAADRIVKMQAISRSYKYVRDLHAFR